jgi:hypothetical protein
MILYSQIWSFSTPEQIREQVAVTLLAKMLTGVRGTLRTNCYNTDRWAYLLFIYYIHYLFIYLYYFIIHFSHLCLTTPLSSDMRSLCA